MKKIIEVAVATASLLIVGTAMAAQPNNQACLGHDFAGYAQGGSNFGNFVSGLATGTSGVGNEVQAHLAGDVPDSTLPNSCNN